MLPRIQAILASVGVPDFALTGAVALGVWTVPRFSDDVDLCGVLPKESVDRLLALHDGFAVGPSEVPDIVRFRAGRWDVDLFVAKDEHDLEVLRRAQRVELGDVSIKVVTPEDLLIHKMKKLRVDRRKVLQDLADVVALVRVRGDGLDRNYLDGWLTAKEREVIDAAARGDQEAMLKLLDQP